MIEDFNEEEADKRFANWMEEKNKKLSEKSKNIYDWG